jgi:hypothetical protein
MSKGKKLFKKLSKTPMTFGQMQGFVFKLTDNGTYPREKLTKNGHPNGYWGTNFAQFNRNRLIIKGEDKLYRLTELGRLNMDKPFTDISNLKQSEETIAQKKEEDFEWFKSAYNNMIEESCELRNENFRLRTKLYSLKSEIDNLFEV